LNTTDERTAPEAPPTNRLAPVVKRVEVVTAPEPARAPARASVVLLVALVALGTGLRLAALGADRCLWIDEAMLALNLVARSPAELLRPLDYNQGAPVGFLLLSKAAIAAFGSAEWALRLVPCVASVCGLFGFAWLARRLLPSGGALLATALFALSPHLISYAGECKQYASDASIAIGLLACAVPLLDGRGGRAGYAAFGASGAVAVWFSHPAAFVLAGLGSALLLKELVARDRAKLVSTALVVGAWLVSFAACYFLCLKQLSANEYLTGYWADHFVPRTLGAASWLADHLVALFELPGGFGGPAIPLAGFAALLALVGLVEFGRENRWLAGALVGPVAFLLCAAALKKYPFGGRLALFVVPFAVLLAARGAWVLNEALRPANRFAAVALVVLLVGSSAWQSAEELRRPTRSEQLAPVLHRVRAEMNPSDRAYVYYGAVPAFRFYTREHALPASAVELGTQCRESSSGYRDQVAGLRGRTWVIFSHPHRDEETLFRALLDARGQRVREMKDRNSVAWLYELPD
jgi:4-amino-4-deoxy-L-arabinose transferase-like glycosyltransferase